jgi:radical SAM protein with 4Fe4S-binding SPASM domain
MLQHIDIEVDHRCNLACKHCSARAAKGRHPDELTVEQIERILSSAGVLGLRKVGLTGGEPLIDVLKLEAVARYCIDKLSIPVHMHTNGTLVAEEHCRGVLALFESVSVTFLGGDAETHDGMTKTPGSFERSIRGGMLCASAGLPLTCYFIPTRGTCPGFRRLAERLAGLGISRIRAMALAPSGRARPIYGDTAPDREELQQFEKDLLAVRDQLGLHIEAGYCTRLSMPGLSVLAGHDLCMSGISRVHINSKGDVFPCTAASGVSELKLGNVVDAGLDLADIWQNSKTVTLIRAMHRGELSACDSCTRAPRCRDSCTVNACGTMTEAERSACPICTH